MVTPGVGTWAALGPRAKADTSDLILYADENLGSRFKENKFELCWDYIHVKKVLKNAKFFVEFLNSRRIVKSRWVNRYDNNTGLQVDSLHFPKFFQNKCLWPALFFNCPVKLVSTAF